MKKIEFTDEQRKDFASSLIKTLLEFFKKTIHSEKPLRGKELNDYLLSQTASEEERETLLEMFEENETYHSKLTDYKESGKNIDDWYEEQISETIKQQYPDATTDDIDKVKEAVAKQIDEDIESSISALEDFQGLVSETAGKGDAE